MYCGGERESSDAGLLLVLKKMPDSQSFLVTVPGEWEVEEYAKNKRKFPSVQDYIRELIRRDIEQYEKEAKEAKERK